MTDATNTTPAITTRKAAYFQIGLAEARIAKATATLEADTARIAELKALIPTLPEQVLVDTRVYAKDDSITFNYGRGDKRTQITGVVVAVKNKDDGKVDAYRVKVGEDFDATLYTVLPGSVVRLDGTSEDDGQEEPNADDLLNDIGNA